MSDLSAPDQRARFWGKAWVTGILVVSAACTIGFGAFLAFSRDDTEALESPLVMSAARQLFESPRELYGPFGGQNPWVLIHAPLYYRMTALAAWPMARAGIDPVLAALVVGRSLSMVGLMITLAASFRLARLDGAPPIAGWWTVLLIVATPLLGAQPYSVRPDMLGIAFQTAGLLLVLTVLRSKKRRSAMLAAAFAAFALTVCVKQHFIVVPGISTVLLLAAWRRDRHAPRLIGGGLVLALTVLGLVYGAEEVVTKGGLSRAILFAAANVGRVHPSNWTRVLIVFLAIIGRTAGISLLISAAGLCVIQNRPGRVRGGIAILGTCCIGLFIGLQAHLLYSPNEVELALSLMTVTTMNALLIPICALFERRSDATRQLDAILWLFVFAELALVVVLCRVSTGAWVNYAIQAAVFACILSARALARALAGATTFRSVSPIMLATLVMLAGPLFYVYPAISTRQVENLAKEMIFDRMKRPRDEFFFLDRPGDNRLNGRLDLVYDDWLYPVFESAKLAEPRSAWLLLRLTGGQVRIVVTNSDDRKVPGVGETLPELGFAPRIQVGPFFVWERDSAAIARRRQKRNR